MPSAPTFQQTRGEKGFHSTFGAPWSIRYRGNSHSDAWRPNSRPLAIDKAVQRLLSFFVKGMGFLIWGVGDFVEQVRFLTLSSGFVKWVCSLVKRMRSFVERVRSFIEWVSRLVERVTFVLVRPCVGGFRTSGRTWKSSSEPKRNS